MTPVLRAASPDDPFSVWEMLREIGPGENGFGNSAHDLPRRGFRKYLRGCADASRGIGLPPGYVPQTTFWLWSGDRPVGISKLRHTLTEALLREGGNIGYCIRHSERGRGHGTLILRETLKEARAIGLGRVLVTCNPDNLPSRRAIEGNLGVLENIAHGKCRYWIDLTP